MNRFTLAIMVATTVAIITPTLYGQRGRGHAQWREEPLQYGWMLDYEAAKTKAREANKPLMVVFRCVP